MSGLRSDLKLLDSLIGKYLPVLKNHLTVRGIDLSPITMNWFLCLFVNTLPAEESHRVLDCLLHEGPKVLFRAALGILAIREAELLKAEAVVDAYMILRAPFGGGPVEISGGLTSASPNGDLIGSMYGLWLKGLSTQRVGNLREEHLGTVRREDEAQAARRQAWKTAQSSKAKPVDADMVLPKQKETSAQQEAEVEVATHEPSAEDGCVMELEASSSSSPQPQALREASFALVEQLPAARLGYAERAPDSPHAAANWLARVTKDEVNENVNDSAAVDLEETKMWEDDRGIQMESPTRDFNFLWCCRRE